MNILSQDSVQKGLGEKEMSIFSPFKYQIKFHTINSGKIRLNEEWYAVEILYSTASGSGSLFLHLFSFFYIISPLLDSRTIRYNVPPSLSLSPILSFLHLLSEQSRSG